jgi:threonyl-tRNA synthetase
VFFVGPSTEVDVAADTFNKKIRNAVTRKVPNILIVGNKEVETNAVTLRRYCVKDQITLTVAELRERLVKLRDDRIMDNDATVVV